MKFSRICPGRVCPACHQFCHDCFKAHVAVVRTWHSAMMRLVLWWAREKNVILALCSFLGSALCLYPIIMISALLWSNQGNHNYIPTCQRHSPLLQFKFFTYIMVLFQQEFLTKPPHLHKSKTSKTVYIFYSHFKKQNKKLFTVFFQQVSKANKRKSNFYLNRIWLKLRDFSSCQKTTTHSHNTIPPPPVYSFSPITWKGLSLS